MHFGALRVLNDDTVAPGYGFGAHPHDNMEIVSIPLEGDLHHRDSTGRDRIIQQGDVQIMSAGSGITHSEMNGRRDAEVKFLQIWVYPKERNIEPRYDQKSFSRDERMNRWQTVVSPDDPTAVYINQDARFCLGRFTKDMKTTYNLHRQDCGAYVFVVDGSVHINGHTLHHRDAMGIWDAVSFDLKAESDSEILVIEVPMQMVR